MSALMVVKHREGECAVVPGFRLYEGVSNVPTVCGHFVVLPGGWRRGWVHVSCPDCKEVIARERP